MTPFSDKTWTRFRDYVAKWTGLEGPQAEIARDFAAKNWAVRGTGSSPAPIPQHGGYHQTCYAQRIERTTKSMRKKADAAASTSKLRI